MGFAEGQAVRVLEQTKGNVEDALQLLLASGPEGVPQQSVPIVQAQQTFQAEESKEQDQVSVLDMIRFPYAIEVGTMIDYRGAKYQWKQATVKSIDCNKICLGVDGDGDGEEKQVHVLKEWEAIQGLGTYTCQDTNDLIVDCGTQVYVYAYEPYICRSWVIGSVVEKVHGQVLVQYQNQGRSCTHWFPLNRPNGYVAICSMDEFDVFRQMQQFVEESMIYHDTMMVRVLDERRVWCLAEVVRRELVGGWRILVRYDKWNSEYTEWLDVHSEFRIRLLGDETDIITEDMFLQEKEDRKFQRRLQGIGLMFVSQKNDGNCLYSSIAHQVFGDASMYDTVKESCFDHILTHEEHYESFINEPLSVYVERQRCPSEWGGHLEIVALSELYNHPVYIYDQTSDTLPSLKINNEKDPQQHLAAIRLSYHGKNHYNSVVASDVDHTPLGVGGASQCTLLQ